MTYAQMLAEAEKRVRERNGASVDDVKPQIRVWHVKCVYPSTSVTLRIKALSGDEAIGKARKAKIGKGAVDYVVVSVE